MLEMNNISFGYKKGAVSILENISFTAKPGEITTIIGANGAGKTTTLKCISGLIKCTGSVKMCSRERKDMSREELANILSFLDQSTDCNANLTVYEIVLLGRLSNLGFKVSSEDMEAVNKVMELMNITKFASRKITELSGGERKMVFIAQTLIKEPKILMLDEPTGALDLSRQFRMLDRLRKVTKEMKCTTLMTLHHLDMAAMFSDRIVVINDKHIYADGTPHEVMNSKMLEDVYHVNSEVYTDSEGRIHLIALDAIKDRTLGFEESDKYFQSMT